MTVAEQTREALEFIGNQYNFMYQSDMTALDRANTERLVASGIGVMEYDSDMQDYAYVLSGGEKE